MDLKKQVDMMSKIMPNSHTNTHTVQEVELAELTGSIGNEQPLLEGNLEIIKNVRVKLEVMMGGAELSVGELYDLQKDSVIKLDRDTQEPMDLLLNGKIVARGTLVVSGDNFGICLTEIAN